MNRKKCLVIALGNPLQGDDGFGAAVLGRLSRDPDVLGCADLVDAHTDLLSLVAELAAYERVVLVDAVLTEDGAGDVAVLSESAIASHAGASLSAHQMSPGEVVRLFRVLHPQARTEIRVVGLRVREIRHGTEPCRPAALVDGEDAVRELVGLRGRS